MVKVIPVVLALISTACTRCSGEGIRLLPPKNQPGASIIETLSASIDEREGGPGYAIAFQPADWPHIMEVYKTPQDWSGYGGITMDLENPFPDTVRLSIRIDDDYSKPLENHCTYGSITLGPNSQATVTFPFNSNADIGMRAGPPFKGKQMEVSGGKLDWRHITAWQMFMDHPKKVTILVVSNIRFAPKSKLQGIVDRYGQYSYADWPGKIKDDAQMIRAHESESKALLTAPADWDEYGGWKMGPQLAATGHFRTEKRDGRWWLVTPSGHLFYSIGLDVVHPWERTMVTGREEMFSWLPSQDDPLVLNMRGSESNRTIDFYSTNLQRVYGSDWAAKWQGNTIRRMRSWGFNTIANWSEPSMFNTKKAPYVVPVHPDTPDVPIFKCGSKQLLDIYDPRYPKALKLAIAATAEPRKDDPWCIGFFVDNEIPWDGWWGREKFELPRNALALSNGSAIKHAFTELLRAKYGEIGKLNSAWGTRFESWNKFESDPVTLPEKLNDAQKEDCAALVTVYAEHYYSMVSAEMKETAPKKLYLGSRIAGIPYVEVAEVCAKYADVVSFNIYENDIKSKKWEMAGRLNKPCIIGEFHFGALDRGMFHGGLRPVKNQAERASAYVNYVSSVLRNPAFVGCHWFQYVDEPLTGRGDGENYNIGFVSVADIPYPELVDAASKLNRAIYSSKELTKAIGAQR